MSSSDFWRSIAHFVNQESSQEADNTELWYLFYKFTATLWNVYRESYAVKAAYWDKSDGLESDDLYMLLHVKEPICKCAIMNLVIKTIARSDCPSKLRLGQAARQSATSCRRMDGLTGHPRRCLIACLLAHSRR
eukprot:747421-Hanusia_phi.AAC.4